MAYSTRSRLLPVAATSLPKHANFYKLKNNLRSLEVTIMAERSTGLFVKEMNFRGKISQFPTTGKSDGMS